jgi:uncharacterized membrane protein YsdA (DUF1294 family)/cold shock CspA family protein
MGLLRGTIIEWNRERGFGYVGCDKRRVFLHIRDFKVRHKWPEAGDVVQFFMGEDEHGRSCAKEAVQASAPRGRLRLGHILLLGGLLILPGYAIYQAMGHVGLMYAAGWYGLLSGLAYLVYAIDKRRARDQARREPEKHMHLLELLGGWPGAFLAQRLLRHKSSKGPYQFVFILIIGLHQFLAIDALLGWPFIHVVVNAVRQLR